MAAFNLSEGQIRQNASTESFRRGQEYYGEGAVISLLRRGDVLEAEVEGSYPEPYSVRIVFDAAGVTEVDCDCPYSFGGWCKHIVASLLACLNEPEKIEERQPLAVLISELRREELATLLEKLVEEDSHLATAIERQVTLLRLEQATATTPPADQPKSRRSQLDTRAIRQQVKGLLRSIDYSRSSEAYWQVGGVVAGVRQVLDRAWAFVKAGDGYSALAILEAITEEYLAGWEMMDDSDGDASGFFADLGAAWTEALLTAELTPREREDWAEKLDEWNVELEDYGLEDAFAAAQAAASQGWDDPDLQMILRGEMKADSVSAPDWVANDEWEEEIDWDDGLAEAQLNVLERQGRFQEYLRLADAKRKPGRYVAMLVQLGKLQEAAEYGLTHLKTANQALSLAKALRDQGEMESALRLAEQGLSLRGPVAALAAWLCDLAGGMGRPELALTAAEIAFREEPNLPAFARVEETASEKWPERRSELLAYLRQVRSYQAQGPVEIFLHEGLVEDAIAAVEGSFSYDLIAQVADAAIESHPDWVISTSRRQAEVIMDQGKAQYYDHAARWVARAKAAYLVAGRDKEWREYLEGLINKHQRKYKLRPMLEALRR